MKKGSLSRIFTIWWPLAASWLFMGTELPMISAVMARMPDPKIHLAAYGGVVFPIALIIEAPIIMLLAASTALSKDWASYQKVRKYMIWAGFILTIAHFLLAYTPLYYTVIVGIMKPPPEIVEPARIGLMIMIPWTWTIAYRRFQQGVLIRFGHSKAVGVGTALRMAANAITLAIGWNIGGLPGIVVGTSGIAVGVITEAIYAGLRVRPVLRDQLMPKTPIDPALTWRAFYDFYLPLAATSLLNLIVMPMGSAAVARMPEALNSLAVWPVLNGFLFMWRSMGFAYNEVVVAELDEKGSAAALQRFAWLLGGLATVGLALVAVTPLAKLWFVDLSGLDADLSGLARSGLWVALLWPVISILQNFYQGVLVNGRKTRAITESVLVFFTVTGLLLYWGASTGLYTGLFVALVAFQTGYGLQTVWLWYRSRGHFTRMAARDTAFFQAVEAGAAAD